MKKITYLIFISLIGNILSYYLYKYIWQKKYSIIVTYSILILVTILYYYYYAKIFNYIYLIEPYNK